MHRKQADAADPERQKRVLAEELEAVRLCEPACLCSDPESDEEHHVASAEAHRDANHGDKPQVPEEVLAGVYLIPCNEHDLSLIHI